MKILVTNNTLANIGGSETYAYALIMELKSRPNFEVHAFSKNIGLVGQKLIENGVKVINNITDNDYDLVLASHTSTIPYLKNLNAKKIQTCHGIYPSLEQPHKDVDEHVSISYEVRTHLLNKGFNSKIIHNGIDCDRFNVNNKINEKLTNVLSLAQSDELNKKIRVVCDKLGLNLLTLNKFINGKFNVNEFINESDLVISLGRGAFESMACGRNVLILDKRPYVNRPPIGDGILTEENVNDFIINNCSGRFTNKVFDLKEIEEELLKYDPKHGEFLRGFAEKELNIKTQVDKYLNL